VVVSLRSLTLARFVIYGMLQLILQTTFPVLSSIAAPPHLCFPAPVAQQVCRQVRGGGAVGSRRSQFQSASCSSGLKAHETIAGVHHNDSGPASFHGTANLRFWRARCLYLFAYATVGAVAPFLSTFLVESLAMTPSALGLVGAVTPVMTTACTPLWGALADRTGEHGFIMVANHIVSVLVRLVLVVLAAFFNMHPQRTWVAIAAVAIAASLMSSVYSIMDDLCFRSMRSVVEEDPGSWARLRMFGSVGFGLGALLTGQLADRSRFGYGVAFLVSVCMACPAAILMIGFGAGPERRCGRPSKVLASFTADTIDTSNLTRGHPLGASLSLCWRNQRALIKSLWCVVVLCGANFASLEVFLFPLLRSRGLQGHTLGLIRATNGISSVPFFFWSGRLISCLGVVGTFSLATAAYALRLAFHAIVVEAHIATTLTMEVLYGVSGGGFWAAATVFARALAPEGASSTMMGVLTSLHYGVGSVLGSYFGGFISARMAGDVSRMFRLAALLNAGISASLAVSLVLARRGDQKWGPANKDGSNLTGKLLFGQFEKFRER
jgi:MFS family permease